MRIDDLGSRARSSIADRIPTRVSRRRRASSTNRSRLRTGPRLEALEERTVLSTSTLTISAVLGNASANPISGTINVYYYDSSDTLNSAPLNSSNGFSQTLTVYTGSTVSFDPVSDGSTATEQWATSDPSITVNSNQSDNITYYDQLSETFAASTANAGVATPMSDTNYVTASYTQFGSTVNDATQIYDGNPETNVWVDNGSTASLSADSTGSGASERWQYDSDGDQPTFAITSSTTLSASYFDQVDDTLAATTAAGGNQMDVGNFITAQYFAFNNFQQQATYDGFTPSVWIDRDTTANTVVFSADSAGSNGTERWQYDGNDEQPTFMPDSSTTFSATYFDQLSETFAATAAAGGTAMTSLNGITVSFTAFGSGGTDLTYDGTTPSDWVDRAATPTVTFSAVSSGSSGTERWQYDAAGDPPVFTPDTSTTFSAVYYNQYLDTFEATTVAGGVDAMTVTNDVTASYNAFGMGATIGLYDGYTPAVWVDSATTNTVSYTAASSGSDGTERWQYDAAGDPPSFTPNSALTFAASYYNQFYETFEAATFAGGTDMTAANDVTASYNQFGTPSTLAAYDGSLTSLWVDGALTNTVIYSATSSGSTGTERWQYDVVGNQPSFTPDSATTFTPVYYDQYYETFEAMTAPGGTAMTAANGVTAFYDQFSNPLTQSIYDGNPESDWVDRASTSTITFSADSSDSSGNERWQYDAAGDPPSFTPSTSTTFAATYYDQVSQTFTAITSNGTPMDSGNYVTASYEQFGSPYNNPTAIYDGQSLSNVWVDNGTTAVMSADSTGSGAAERWQAQAMGQPTFPISGAGTQSATYYDQVPETFAAMTVNAASGTAMSSANYVTASYVQFDSMYSDPSPIYDGHSLTNIWVDNGSTATMSLASTGSGASERWQAQSQPTWTFNGISPMTGSYFDQVSVTFAAMTVNVASGTAMNSANYVTANYTQFNGVVNDPTAIYDGTPLANVWVDNGTTATMSNTSTGSGASERWQAQASGSPSVTISASGTQTVDYYDQLSETFAATTANAAVATPMSDTNYVTASYTQFGSAINDATQIYDGNPETNVWVDNGSTATLSADSTGSGASERWQYDSDGDQPTFAISSSTTLSASYFDQVDDTLAATTAAGGNQMDVGNFITAQYFAFNNFQQQATYDGFTPSVWIDRDTDANTVSFSADSAGSNGSERWQYDSDGDQPTFMPDSSTTFSATYYDQLSETFAATTAAGGTAMTAANAITVSFTAFGSGGTDLTFDGTTPSDWVDRAATPTVTFGAGSSGSSGTERWQYDAAGNQPSFTPSTSTTFSATYYNQYLLTVTGNPAAHGTPSSTGTAFGQDVSDGGVDAFYDAGTTAHATLAAGQVTESGVTYTFTGWSGAAGGTGLISSAITMSAPMTATADWQTAASFSDLSAPTITYGTPATTISGTISNGSATPFPSGQVAITIDGVTQDAAISPIDGSFSIAFDTGTLGVISSPYTIGFAYAGDANYSAVTGSSTLTVGKATPTIDWTPSVAAITYGTPLSGAQLDATASTPNFPSVAGTFLYAQVAGTILNAGGQTLSATFVPNDLIDFNSASGTASLSVAKATPTINVTGYNATYNGAAHTATGVVTGVGGAVLGGLNLGGTAHTGAGTYAADPWTFTDSTGNYNNASGTVSDSIAPAALTVTATNSAKTYGNAWTPSGTGYVVSGLVGGDTVTGVALASDGSSASAKVGNYPITAGNAVGTGLGNYNITYATGILGVSPAPTSAAFVTPSGSSAYGQDAPLVVQVASEIPGTPVPSGTVVFFSDGAAIATVALDASGRASLDASSLAIGDHTISATYQASPEFLAGAAAPITWQLNQAATSTGLSIDPVRNARGKVVSVILSADVAAVAPGGGQPGGVVTFYRGNRKQMGISVLTGGVATYRLSPDQAMGNSFWVNYGGAADFSGSQSTSLPVNRSSVRAAERTPAPQVATPTSGVVRAAAERLSRILMGVLPTFPHKKTH